MDVLKFTLKGPFAFFKKPDVNTFYYFTYGNIHKISLLGIFGAILGYKGYNQCFNSYNSEKFDYPMFYEKLKDIKISIAPKKINLSRKVQTYNNSICYYNKDKNKLGCNLVVNEQWLEEPIWDIYLKLDNKESEKIANAILAGNFVYLPYLGKNDHFADIEDAKIIKDVCEGNDFTKLDCLYLKRNFQVVGNDHHDDFDDDHEKIFKYEEKLPIELEKETNKYELASFIFTNSRVRKTSDIDIFNVQGKNIVFY